MNIKLKYYYNIIDMSEEDENKRNRVCNECKKEFLFPYKLERHLKSKNACQKELNRMWFAKKHSMASKIILQEDEDSNIDLHKNIPNNPVNEVIVIDDRANDWVDQDENEGSNLFREELNVEDYLNNTIKPNYGSEIVCVKCHKSFKTKKTLYQHVKGNRCKYTDLQIVKEKREDACKNIIMSLMDKSLNEQDTSVLKQNFDIANKFIIELGNSNSMSINKCIEIHDSLMKLSEKLLTKQEDTNINNQEQNINNNRDVNVHNGNNIDNHVENNTTNNITNNNINNNINFNFQNSNTFVFNNVQLVCPFSYENISFLTKNEKKKIVSMNTSDAIIDLIIKVYDRVENQNFYKSNKSVNNISYVNDKCKISVKDKNQFLKQLFLNCLFLYLRVVYEYKSEYKNEITCEELLNIVTQYVEMKTIVEKDYKLSENTNSLYVKIKNFYEAQIENENIHVRDSVNKFKSAKMKDHDINAYFENIFETLTKKIKDLQLDLEPTIDDDTIISALGEIIELDLDDSQVKQTLQLNKFENTPYKQYYDQRFKEEQKLILNNPCLGNLVFLNQKIKDQNEFMNNVICAVDNLTKIQSIETA